MSIIPITIAVAGAVTLNLNEGENAVTVDQAPAQNILVSSPQSGPKGEMGITGPKGEPGDIEGLDIPDLTLIFENGLI